jgi:hypothetical protein
VMSNVLQTRKRLCVSRAFFSAKWFTCENYNNIAIVREVAIVITISEAKTRDRLFAPERQRHVHYVVACSLKYCILYHIIYNTFSKVPYLQRRGGCVTGARPGDPTVSKWEQIDDRGGVAADRSSLTMRKSDVNLQKHIWTHWGNIRTHSVNIWTHSGNIWTLSVNIWTHSVNIWTHSGNIWTHSVNIWTHSVNIWTHSGNNWTQLKLYEDARIIGQAPVVYQCIKDFFCFFLNGTRSFYLKWDEFCNFLNTCRMATPLRECKAPSIFTNELGLRPMGWSWRWSIQGSIITFT